MAESITETIARAIWETREMCFPEKVRMSWGGGTDLARAATLRQAADLIAILPGAGYAIVPIKPTQDMISAGIIERHEQPTPEAWSLATANIYRAMVDAALDSEKGE